METTTALTFQIHHQFPSASSPPLPAHLRRHHHQNVRRQLNFTMPLRNLTLRRITTNRYNFKFNHATEAFCVTNPFISINHHTMAEESKNKGVVQEEVDTTSLNVGQSKEETSKKSTPEIPPPPEKPLPDDCCGSGCVRCVWDVYYEEVEEYNRLYKKADSKIS